MTRRAHTRRRSPSCSLTIRIDAESKSILTRAAELRRVSVSEYVQAVAVPQARHQLAAAKENVIALTADEQLVFWRALRQPPKLTAAQKRLGALMRGNP